MSPVETARKPVSTNTSAANTSAANDATERAWTPGEGAPDVLQPNLERNVSFGVGQAGGICIYGINSRRPVTLYAQQWIDLAPYMDQVLEYIGKNKHRLAWKPKKSAAEKNGRTTASTPDADSILLQALMAKGKTREEALEILQSVE